MNYAIQNAKALTVDVRGAASIRLARFEREPAQRGLLGIYFPRKEADSGADISNVRHKLCNSARRSFDGGREEGREHSPCSLRT